jgi:hypothetical protein
MTSFGGGKRRVLSKKIQCKRMTVFFKERGCHLSVGVI